MLDGIDDLIPTVIDSVSERVEARYGRSAGVITALLLAVLFIGILGAVIWLAIS